jgi:hypothetical protein
MLPNLTLKGNIRIEYRNKPDSAIKVEKEINKHIVNGRDWPSLREAN